MSEEVEPTWVLSKLVNHLQRLDQDRKIYISSIFDTATYGIYTVENGFYLPEQERYTTDVDKIKTDHYYPAYILLAG